MSNKREAAVLDALSGVRDPELDEPITELDFVSGVEVTDEVAKVTLRLPTFFCAPNFSYLMVEDSRVAALSVEGVNHAEVELEGHHVSGEINAGVADDRGFDAALSDFEETSGENLDALRTIFKRKAFVRRQEILCRKLMSGGATPEDLARMSVGEVSPSKEREVYLERREELGLRVSPEAPLLVDPDGNRVPETAVVEHLKRARLTRSSLESNATFCQSLLAARYGLEDKSIERAERMGA